MFGTGGRIARALSGAGGVLGLMTLAFVAGVVVGGVLAARFDQEQEQGQGQEQTAPASAPAPEPDAAAKAQQHG